MNNVDTAVSSVQQQTVRSRGPHARFLERERVTAQTASEDRLHAIPVPTGLPADPLVLRALYRVFEVLLASALLLITSPLIILQAIVIRLDSPGRVLFWQERFARSDVKKGRDLINDRSLIPPSGGFQPDQDYLVPQTFRFVKFRTMFADARQRFPELYAFRFPNHEAAMRAYYKDKDDPRITRVGRFLRRTTLDELPNLVQVLTGEMRLVGPRPEGAWVIRYYSPEQMILFTVKPGVTGLAQSMGRSHLPIGERLAYDLEYVRTRSVWLDIKILAMTFVGVITQRGAY